MAISNSERLRKIKEERERENTSLSSNSARLKEYIIQKDIADISNRMGNVSSGWQDKLTMQGNESRLKQATQTVSDYLNSNQGSMSDDQRNAYSNLLDSYNKYSSAFDSAKDYYSNFLNSEAFNKNVRKNELTSKYQGKSYDEIQDALKKATSDDERDYLRNYTDYSSNDDFQKAIDNATAGIDSLAKRNHTIDKQTSEYVKNLRSKQSNYNLMHASDEYKDLVNNPDFEKYSDPSAIIRAEMAYGNKSMGIGYDKSALDGISEKVLKRGALSDLNGVPYLFEMSEDLQRKGAYIYNTDNTPDKSKYRDFLRKVAVEASNEISLQKEQDWADKSTQNFGTGFGASVANTLGRPVAYLGATLEGAAGLINSAITGTEYNPYYGMAGLGRTINASQQALTQSINDAIDNPILETAARIGYGALTEGAVSRLGQMATGGAYNFIMGGGVAAQAYGDALREGMGKEYAMGKALAAGAIETATEQIGMEAAFSKMGEKAWWNTILKQGLAEGSEEVVGNVANLFYDSFVNGKNSEIMTDVQNDITKGYSKEEAWARAVGKFITETLEEAGTAALSAGLTGAGSVVATSNVGKQIDFAKLGEAVGTFSEDSKTRKAYDELLSKYEGASKVPNWNKGVVYQQASNENREAVINALTDEKDINGQGYADAYMQRVALKNAVNETPAKKNAAVNEESQKVTDESSASYIERQAKNYNDVEGALFKENYNGQNVLHYQTTFDYIKDYADHRLDPERMLSNVSESIMPKTKALEIYQKIVANNGMIDKARVEANNKILEKWSGEYSKQGTFDDSAITKDVYNSLNKNQRKFVDTLKIFSKMGMNIKLIHDERATSINGSADGRDIVINLAARFGKDVEKGDKGQYAVNTFAHESTHWMENILGDEFEIFKDLIRTSVGTKEWNKAITLEIGRAQEGGSKLTTKQAESEAVARFCEDMLNDMSVADRIFSNASQGTIEKLINAVKRWFEKIRNDLREWMKGYDSKSDEASLLKQMDGVFESVQKAWSDMFERALKVNQATKAMIESDPVNVVNDNTVLLSEKTYEKGGKEYMRNYLNSLVNTGELDQDSADQIVEQLDSMYELSKKFSVNPNFMDYSEWQKTDAITDVFGKSITTIMTNGDYPFNIDMSTVCKKRKALDKVLNTLAKEGDFDNYLPSGETITELQRIIKEHGFEIACGLCFVDAKRYRVGQWANSYLNGYIGTSGADKGVKHYGYNEMVMQMAKLEKTKADFFRFLDTDKFLIKSNGDLHTRELTKDSPSIKYLDNIIKNSNKGSNNYIIATALREKPELRKLLTGNQIISSAGLDNMRVIRPDLFDMVKASSGQATPKLSLSEVPFTDEVLKEIGNNPKKAEAMREKLRKVGGYRVQSFSDYMANMVFDYVQLVSNFSALKYTSHAYTKEYFFVKLFGLTGMKINMSIVPAATSKAIKERFNDVDESKLSQKKYDSIRDEYNYYKAHAGLEKATKKDYDYYDEEDGTYWKYILEDECFPIDKVDEIITDPRYSKNCGTIWVGVSNKHIKALLNDPKVAQVIPYHKSSINPIVAHLRNVWMYNDYEDFQTEKLNGKSLKANKFEAITGYNFYDALAKAERKWAKMSDTDKAKRSVPQMAADEYLAVCKKHKITPKFQGVMLDGHDITEEDNYYKVLSDFSLIDSEGNYARQNAVSMTFPENFGKLMEKSLKEAQKTSDKMNREQADLLKEAREIINADKGTLLSSKVDSKGRALSEGQIKLFADESPLLLDAHGNLKRYYHGTARKDRVGYIFDPARATSGPMAYFTDDEQIASNYARDKKDTSTSRDERYDDYHTQFRIEINGKDMSVSEAWNALPMSKRNEIKQKAAHITVDWDNEEDIIYDENTKNGLGNFDAYEINAHKGNYIDTLVSSWLDDGMLYQREGDFLQVLELIGLDNVTYLDPNFRDEGVFEEYLHITNPLDTSNISEADIEAIRKASKTAKSSEIDYAADWWDKTSMPPERWMEKFEDDIKDGTTNAWTVIPDWVTDTLKSLGYDGIVDQGGKYHPNPHQVVIPFSSEQVKDIDNLNPTDNPDRRYSKKVGDEGYHLDDKDTVIIDDVTYSKNKTKKDFKGVRKEVRDYLRQLNGQKVTITSDGRIVIFDAKTASEYTGSKDVENASIDAKRSKMNAAKGLIGIVERAVNPRWRANTKPKHNVDAQRGFTYYDVNFGFSNGTLNDYYKGNLIVRMDADGNDYVYDVEDIVFVKTAKETNHSATSQANLTRSVSSANNVAQSGQPVNNKMSSRKVHDDTYDLLDQTARVNEDTKTLERDINRLARLVNLQKKAPNGMLFSPQRLNIIADRLLKMDGVSYDKEDLINGLNRAYAEITDAFSNETDTTAQDIMDACTFLASKITDPAKAVIQTEDSDTNMVIDEFSRMERVKEVARGIYNNYWSVASVNLGEAVAEKVRVLNEDHRKAMSELRQSRDKAIAELRQNKNEVIKKIREERDKKFEEYKEARKQMDAERKKNAEKNAYVKKITDTAMTLTEWLKKNDGKSGKSIPEALKPAVTKLLEAIDYSSKQALGMRGGKYSGMTTKKDRAIAEALTDIREYMFEEHDDEIYIDLHENIVNDMKEIINAIDNIISSDSEFVLNKMSNKDLETLDMVMTALKTSITNINERIGAQGKGKISDAAIPDVMENRELGKKQSNKYTKGIKTFFEWTNTLPQYAFEHLGKGAQEMFQELRDGWSKFAFHTQKIINFAKETWNGKEYEEWHNNVHEFEVNGKKIEMTDTQIMSLYCLAKRQQALNHIYVGGIKISTFEGKRGGEHGGDKAVLTKADIDNITSVLSDRQIEVANAIQGFMNDTCKEWMNEITMKRWGIKGATEENYFPINVDANTLMDSGEPKDMPKSIFRLINMGFTKPINDKATNPVVVDDIIDVFKTHATDMAKYNALALPILDMHRYYNFKQKTDDGDILNMKESIEDAYGKEAKNYITKFLLDLNSNREESRGGKMFKLAKGYKVAAVAGNLQVAALQPVAVTRARMYLSKKNLLKGFFHVPSGIDAMLKNSGIAVWKDLSLFDTDIASGVDSKIKQNRSWKDKFVEWTMKLAETMDKVTWGAIWSACEAEQSANGLRGEELTKATLKEFDDIIYHTQVVDSTMTRSEIMRGTDPYSKMITSFMSEPTISMNLLQDAGVRYAQDVRRYGKGEALKRNARHIAKCCYIYTLNAGIEAIFRGLMGKYRDWDEDSDEMLANLWKEFVQNVIPLGNIPIGRDIMSLLMGYNVDRMDMASIQSILKAGENLAKVVAGEKDLDYKTIYRAMQAISQATGIPLSSLMRDGSALWNDTIGQMYPSLKIE